MLLDIMMPGMDGFELARLIRKIKLNATVPIIFVTAANTDENFILQGYEVGAIDFIQKPFNAKVLLYKVNLFMNFIIKNGYRNRSLNNSLKKIKN
jgi:DNA-binding response OmpR family regulator